MTKTFLFSKSNRDQLFAADMAHALVLIYQDLLTKPTEYVENLIIASHANIKEIYKHLYGNGNLRLTPKDLKRYKQILKKIQVKVDEILGHEAKLSLDFILGIITIVNDQFEQVKKYSKNQEYVGSWENLLENFQLLYENYDEKMEHESCFKTGLKINEEFYKILNYS